MIPILQIKPNHNSIKTERGYVIMDEVLAFLKENPTFYFATVEGNLPRVRPFGFVMKYEGKLYFTMGDHKKVYKQLLANPNVEICTTNKDDAWIRIRGKAVFDTREEVAKKVFETMPDLEKIYNEETGFKLAACYLKDAEAEIMDTNGGFKKITL